MTNEKLEQKLENNSTYNINSANTEYRIVKEEEFNKNNYLQFKSTKRVINFPDVWNSHYKECWRYIPSEDNGIYASISETRCPTKIPSTLELEFMYDFHNQEPDELTQFIKKYPNIQTYFKEYNEFMEQYFGKRK